MGYDAGIDRTLRAVSVYMFPLVFCLGVPAGVNGPSVIVPLMILPAFATAVLGLIALGGKLKTPYVAIPFDSIMVGAYVGMLFPAWAILNRQGSCNSGGKHMLATYTTVPIMANLLVHAYCIMRHLPLSVSGQTACPNCQHEHEVRAKFPFPAPSTIFPSSTIYTPADDEEDEDRRPLTRDYDDFTIRASSDIDGATLFAGEGRQMIEANQQPVFTAKNRADRQV